MRVLIVEDNPLVAMMLEDELIEAGFEVIGPAPCSRSATDLARASGCDCALVDIDLSDGRTGGRLAGSLSRDMHVPVIFATGQVELARQYGSTALGVLSKPIDTDILVRALKGVERLRMGGDPTWPRELELLSPNQSHPRTLPTGRVRRD